MATQTIIFAARRTPTAVHVRNLVGGTETAGSTITALDDGLYSAEFSALSGDFTLHLLDGSAVMGVGSVWDVTNTASTFYEQDLVQPSSGGGGSGSGAYVVTITVNDGVTALQNATVRLTDGGNSYTATTDVSGVASYSLDNATYTVSITKGGYSFTPTTLAVSGATSHAYSMTAVSVTPSDPGQTTGYVTIYTAEHVAASGATVEIQILKLANGTTGSGIDDPLLSGTTNGSGYVEFTGLPRLATYQARVNGGKWAKGVTLDASSTPLAGVLGLPE